MFSNLGEQEEGEVFKSKSPQPPSSSPLLSSTSASRPGSRQRRARANVIVKEGISMNAQAGWSKEEEEEAIALINEILLTGISPNQLIKQGFRPDLVTLCSNQINLGSSGQPSTSSVQLEAQPKTKRKRRKVGSKGKESDDVINNSTDPANDTITTTSVLSDDKESDSQYADLLRQKVELERERAKLLRLEKERKTDILDQNDQSASSLPASAEHEKIQNTDDTQNTLALDPMQAMRQAALASMKRKRHSNGQEPSFKLGGAVREASHDSYPMTPSSSLPYSPLPNPGSMNGSGDYQSNTPPPNAPRGPRSTLPRYHDIDAPSNLEAIQREIEAAEALQSGEDADLWATDDSNQMHDPRAVSQRTKPLAYYDDVAVPAGQVDYSAPLPSLTSAQPKMTILRDRPGIYTGAKAWRENGSVQQRSLPVTPSFAPFPPRRRSPFLQNGADQRVVLDMSDEEEEDEISEEHTAAREYQNDNAKLMHSIFKAVINGDNPGSGTQPRNVSPIGPSTRSLLLSKEKEIELLKEKMRLLEQKKKADAEQIKAEVEEKEILTESDFSSNQKDTTSNPTTASPSFPTYESPFTCYPGLRAMINEQKSGKEKGN